ncbi:MAG: radical SAM protein [Elusimicrobia bacterium]|nr:radical SAM protein [Elusimicrobiota bacterium]
MEEPLFRPPAEADSLILQVDRGCPYNRCSFCGMYAGVPFRRLKPPEVAALLARAGRPDARRVFLADGDVLRRPFAELAAILKLLGERLPGLARVNLYATGTAIAGKSDAELRALRELKLRTLYLGLESGDEAALKSMRKAESAGLMVREAVRAQACGLHLSVMVLLGLGGKERSAEHARATAAALNRMQPRLLSALRVIPVPGTELQREIRAGRFAELSEYQAVQELRALLAGLELSRTVFRANHASNVVPLEGSLPKDQARLLAELDALLESGRLDRDSPGPAPLWL